MFLPQWPGYYDVVIDGRDPGATGGYPADEGPAFTFTRTGGASSRTTRPAHAGISSVPPCKDRCEVRGSRLDAVEHVDTFWFAWATFAPSTRVIP